MTAPPMTEKEQQQELIRQQVCTSYQLIIHTSIYIYIYKITTYSITIRNVIY